MKIISTAICFILLGGTNAFAPTVKTFGLKNGASNSALQMAVSSEKEVRDMISQIDNGNFEEVLSEVEPFLKDKASDKFYAKVKLRLSDKLWAIGQKLPEDFAKSSSPAPAKAAPAPAVPAPTPEAASEPAPAPATEAKEPASAPKPAAAGGITTAMIKELRELTGAGMMDCKKALQETDGDIDQAIENMRTSGALKAAKKATKVAAEGQIMIKEEDGVAALVEVNCQTDFVAKDETFVAFANKVADAALENKASVEDLQKQFEEERVALVAKIGENINIRRVSFVEGTKVAIYSHIGGKIGVVVAGDGDDQDLKNMCMHVCASAPQYLNPDDVPAEVVEQERKIQIDIAMNEGKPADIAEKMVEGRMKKYTGEVSLTGQPFVMEPKKSVGDVLKEKGTSVTNFVRLEVGEGIEKNDEPNFAEEVAAMAAGKA